MRIALVQQFAGQEIQANVDKAVAAVQRAAQQGAELVCFAELAFEPFYPQWPASGDVSRLAQPIPGPLTERFQQVARENKVVLVLNLFEKDGAVCFDSSPVIDADGQLLGKTRMVHIADYDCFHEKGYYTAGDSGAPVYSTQHGRIGVAICYDRHFPEYMRALALAGAEIVVVPQAGARDEWPDGLFEAEMRVAAFQNGYFVALCNRVGSEQRLEFAGESFVCDPQGVVVARAPAAREHLLLADLDLSTVGQSHARQLFLRDRRPELYGEWLAR